MLEIGDGRGQERSETAKQNRENIIDFFTRNPGATKTQCATSLGISVTTVIRHVKEINGK